MNKKLFLIAILLLSAGCLKQPTPAETTSPDNTVPVQGTVQEKQKAALVFPISDADKRVTKKNFGLYVTPQNSPVSPEKFTGYHVGVDYETFDTEKDSDVSIYAVCDGKVLVARYVGGYGGLLIQSCQLNNQDVTVLYGHMKISSITNKLGKTLKQGDQIGILGQGYSYDTASERKHLHLGVHKGKAIDYKGYVQTKAELSNWLDYQQIK
jgi:murein DD-endopeptidase MepM/ murein hydrolase activator NlpD